MIALKQKPEKKTKKMQKKQKNICALYLIDL